MEEQIECQEYRRPGGEDENSNPRNWSIFRKTLSTIIICCIGFNTTLGASIYTPGHEQVQRELGVSTTVSLLPLSAYSLGLAFGPMISSPLSETFGRKFVYLLTLPLFDLFMLGTGLSRNIASLIICRFFAGTFAAPGVSVATATIADYTDPSKRLIPLSIYYSIPFIGSAIGPLIGSFVTEAKGWRWTAWVVLIIAAVFHPPALYLKESYRQRVMYDKDNTQGIPRSKVILQTVKEFITSTVIRPLHMLTTEPLVGFICLYTGFQFALLYTFVVASPWVFGTVYGFSISAQGLSFLGLVTGCVAAPFILVAVDYYVRQHRHRYNDNSGTSAVYLLPEIRLYTALYGSLVLPVGLFWFGWSARESVHWMVPIIGQGLTILGSLLIYVPCNFYMLDVYGARFGASAAGASSLSRYTLSAAFPLFVTQMYEVLGVSWATSLLGFISVLMLPIPWVFYYTGPRLRARSQYEHGT
ncbi:major facilitator superfamily domain-containing protein [Aspergillus ambiguus]|uniref:MFS transporter n=1 Tax=Aspergillus ambiguus TaxID=176160 RepID=UPI003CCDC9D1